MMALQTSYRVHFVAPLVGAWIEIGLIPCFLHIVSVAPLVGAWIEIQTLYQGCANYSLSLPSWERGLKFPVPGFQGLMLRRSPRGSVD